MDVVRTNIEQIGGSLDLHTRKGEGTTIKVKIPLTLAIVPALIVASGGQRYAIPQVSLLELVGLDAQAATKIESVHGAPVYRLRGQILPIVSLNTELGLPEAAEGSSVTIVVLKADHREFGLVVERVNDTEEIVVKPLSPQCKNINAFSGCTIMGDGHVALILDVIGIAQRARVVTGAHDHSARSDATTTSTTTDVATEALLVVRAGADNRCAIPLRAVDRLEEFARDKIEHTAGNDVVQYRDTILPLVDIASCVGYSPSLQRADTLQVVVHTEGARMVGFIVDEIVDIVEQVIAIHQRSERVGIVGSLVVDGSVTDLLDIHQIVQAVSGWDTDLEAVRA
jgi:two-component system chemotaxis sensor kinase CheA